MCRHFDINFDLLFNMFTSSRFLIIKTFSLRHKLELLMKVLPLTRLATEGDEDCDIPTGCYDSAEICKLVGIYIQNKLCKLMNKKDFGFYKR